MFKIKYFVKTIVFFYVFCALVFVNEGMTFVYHIIDAVFLGSFFFLFIFIKDFKFEISIYVKVIFFFSIYLILSYIWSPVSEDLFYKNLLLQLSLLINGFVFFNLTLKYNLLNIVRDAYLAYVFLNVFVFLGLFDSSFFSPLGKEQLSEIIRFRGVSSNSNLLAMNLFFSSFVLLFFRKNETKFKKRVLYTIALVFIFVMLLSAGSKKGIISFLLLLSFYFYFEQNKMKKNLKFFLSKILIITSPLSLFFLYKVFIQDTLVFERISLALDTLMSGNSRDESTEIRLNLYELAYNGIFQKPVFGNGIDSFSFYHYYYTHTNYLELLFNLGIVGFILYYRLYLSFFKLIKKAKEFKYLSLFLLIILLFVDFSLVSYNLRTYMLFFTFFNIILIKSKEQNENTFYQ